MRNLLISAMMTMGAGAALAQPVQWRVEDGGNGHWYEGVLFSGPQPWSSALGLAIGAGANLASVNTAAEDAFIVSRFLQTSRLYRAGYCCQGPWIGALNTGSGWRWSDGSVWGYTNWHPGNPGEIPPTITCYWDTRQWQDQNEVPNGGPGEFNSVAAIFEWSADCNNDGIVDKGQILSGELPDANNNGIPDWSLTITRQPANQAVGVDQPVFFDVEVASSTGCTTPTVYRWQRRNPQVLDANAPDAWIDLQDGGGFLNTGTAAMAIQRPTAGLATGYRCKISGGCGCEGSGSGVMYTNIVNFAPACPSDFNNDGSVDGDDVITFFERWDSGC
jgi:hypothetical protein